MESGLQDLTEGQANRNVNTLGTKQTIHAKQQHVETSVYIYIYSTCNSTGYFIFHRTCMNIMSYQM